MLAHEHNLYAQGLTLVAGVDEAGVGAWAGPVVAAAVLVGPEVLIPGANDSKKLSARQREQLAPVIYDNALAVSVGLGTTSDIEARNVLGATLLAMERAVLGLKPQPQHLLVDYRQLRLGIPCTALTKGDARVHAIACASIIAKTYRDNLLVQLDEQYPGYGLAQHKGYGTAAHRVALDKLGPSPVHRLGYKPVQRVIREKKQQQLFSRA